MFHILLKSKLFYFLIIFSFLLFVFWLQIFFSGAKEADVNYIFGFLYAQIALIGGINGLLISKKWGGYKSYVGKGIIFFSLGLIGEWFGQTMWTYYNVVARVEIPYPSIGDIGYFSIIPLFALAIFYFAKAAGAKFSLKTLNGKIIAIAIPLIMVLISYNLFLKDLILDLSHPLRTFLDFGYPIGEAITISLALLTYSLSKGTLGGKMRGKILFLIFAMILQYISDSTFLYQAASGTYSNAGINDLLYLGSFTALALALITFTSYE